MRIFVICSKKFYPRISEVKSILEEMGHEIVLPNCYDEPDTEEKMRNMSHEDHQDFKARMYKQSEETISGVDAVLVLNYDKEKNGIVYKNYIGGATFLEMYDAHRLNKKIFVMNDISECNFSDEIDGFKPIIINGNLDIINNYNYSRKYI